MTHNFGPALLNSVYVAVLSTLVTFAVSIPAAYAMSRYKFRGQRFFRQFLLVSQMLSPILLVIGLFKLIIWLGILDNINSIIFVYAAFNIAFTAWMLQRYFATIPVDLEEAAWIEGASRFKTLRFIFLPLAIPALAVTAIFTFINSWNEFVIALTMLRQQENYTLPIQIFSLVAGRYTIEWHHVYGSRIRCDNSSGNFICLVAKISGAWISPGSGKINNQNKDDLMLKQHLPIRA